MSGDFCSASGSRNETNFDPHITNHHTMIISQIINGSQSIEGRKGGSNTQINSGTLFLHERYRTPYNYKSDNVKQLYIIPNIDNIPDIFNSGENRSVLNLDNHHLSEFIKSYMVLLDIKSSKLSPKETKIIVDGLLDMTKLIISDIAHEKGCVSSGSLYNLYNAAKSYIAHNFNKHELTPDLITIHLRCSRATLDRAFKEQNTTVMSLIIKVRLNAAREMLENNQHMRIEQISWLCGFINHPLFSKQFRLKFNVSPKKWRDNYQCLL